MREAEVMMEKVKLMEQVVLKEVMMEEAHLVTDSSSRNCRKARAMLCSTGAWGRRCRRCRRWKRYRKSV